MNTIRPMAQQPMVQQQVLRFSGVHAQVLDRLNAKRLQEDSQKLFGENLDVFVKRGATEGDGTVELVAPKDSKAAPYGSGFIRRLNRVLTGQDIQPEVVKSPQKNPFGDVFEPSTPSLN